MYRSHLYNPGDTYPWTLRPVMHLEDYGINPGSRLPIKGHWYLPVVRYEGHAYQNTPEDKKDFCGSFLFFEQNSTMLYDLGDVKVCASKVDAAKKLLQDMNAEEYDEVIFRRSPDRPQPRKDTIRSEILNAVLKRTNDIEISTDISGVVFHTLVRDLTNIPYRKSGKGYYTPLHPSFGGSVDRIEKNSDYMDQVICRVADKVGIDTLLLQHEFGERNSVTELLNVKSDFLERLVPLTQNMRLRNRIEASKDLAFSPRMRADRPPINPEYIGMNWANAYPFPHTWLPEDGFLVCTSVKPKVRFARGIPELDANGDVTNIH
jgi:hypothetical protein